MPESKKPPKSTESAEPKRRTSGEHPSVRAYRDKLDSIAEGTAHELADIIARAERLKEKSDRPPRDPRREEGDDEEVPVDIVPGFAEPEKET